MNFKDVGYTIQGHNLLGFRLKLLTVLSQKFYFKSNWIKIIHRIKEVVGVDLNVGQWGRYAKMLPICSQGAWESEVVVRR